MATGWLLIGLGAVTTAVWKWYNLETEIPKEWWKLPISSLKGGLKSYLVRLHVSLASTPEELDAIIDHFQLDTPKTHSSAGRQIGKFIKIEPLYHFEKQWANNDVVPST